METIEHNIQQPRLRIHKTPILLQHGAWPGTWCWQQWVDYFASLGYEVHAISLPAHGKSSANKKHINFYTLKDYVNTLASQVESISPRPVVIGHSLGGGILQRYLENHQLPGAVLLASIPFIDGASDIKLFFAGGTLWVLDTLGDKIGYLFQLDPQTGETLNSLDLIGDEGRAIGDVPMDIATEGDNLWVLTSRQLLRIKLP